MGPAGNDGDRMANMTFKYKTMLGSAIVLFLALLTASCITVGLSIRQGKLDHALAAAIKGQNAAQTISLLDQGANPNALVNSGEAVTVQGMLAELWDRFTGAPPHRQYRPTAFAVSFDRNLWFGNATKDDVWAACLRHRANPLTKDEFGSTLLSYAAQDCHAPTVRLLMALHIDPNLKDGSYNFPIIYTNYECAHILLESGANPNCVGICGVTPLMAAAMNDFSTGQLLLDHHARLNAQGPDGQTPLMLACIHHKYNHTGAQVLLNHGARVTIQDRYGKTALDYARKQKARALVARMEAIALQENPSRLAARK